LPATSPPRGEASLADVVKEEFFYETG